MYSLLKNPAEFQVGVGGICGILARSMLSSSKPCIPSALLGATVLPWWGQEWKPGIPMLEGANLTWWSRWHCPYLVVLSVTLANLGGNKWGKPIAVSLKLWPHMRCAGDQGTSQKFYREILEMRDPLRVKISSSFISAWLGSHKYTRDICVWTWF